MSVSVVLFYFKPSANILLENSNRCTVHKMQMNDTCFIVLVDLSSMTCEPTSGCQTCHPAWMSLEMVSFCLVVGFVDQNIVASLANSCVLSFEL